MSLLLLLSAPVASPTIWVGHATSVLGGAWTDVDTGIVGSQVCLRFDPVSRGRTVYLAYKDAGGAAQFRTSESDGNSWSSATEMFAAGAWPTLCVSRDEVVIAAARVGDAIHVRADGRFGEPLTPDTVAVASGVDSDSLILETVPIGAGVWRTFLMFVAGGVASLATSDDLGRTWRAPIVLASSVSRPAMAAHPGSGILFAFWRTAAGTVTGLRVNALSTTGDAIVTGATFTAVPDTVDDLPIDARCWSGGGGVVRVALLVRVSGALVQYTGSGGTYSVTTSGAWHH